MGGFGKGKNQNSSGNTSGQGSQGNSNGNGVNGHTNGNGGVSNSASVGSRRVMSLPKPAYTDQTSEGTVVVNIVVNAQGNVTSASVASGNTSQALKNAALAAAKRAKFSSSDNNAERGTITYRFKQR